MQLFEYSKAIKGNAAIDIIFDAARANEQREPRTVRGYAVSFELRVDGYHNVAVRDPEGVVVALGMVDEYDC